jgi:hypothetical protein
MQDKLVDERGVPQVRLKKDKIKWRLHSKGAEDLVLNISAKTGWLFDADWRNSPIRLHEALQCKTIASAKLSDGPWTVWLCFGADNGNLREFGALQEFEIRHGDCLHFVYPKDTPMQSFVVYANTERIRGWKNYTLPAIFE